MILAMLITDSITPRVSPKSFEDVGKDVTKNCDDISTVGEAFEMTHMLPRYIMGSASKKVNLKLAHIFLNFFSFLGRILLLVLNHIVKVSNHIPCNDGALTMCNQYNLLVILLHFFTKDVPYQLSWACLSKSEQPSLTHQALQEIKDGSISRVMNKLARPSKHFIDLLTPAFSTFHVREDSIDINPQFVRMVILHFSPVDLLVVIILFILFIQLIPEPASFRFCTAPFLQERC
mmetsp:Transcript_8161/g.12778  ORF Transcript_8161/g.12778 Transcript_8161/m.12778 type:complete len:233 (-) Transcript_8161:564-1262(-)